MMDVEQIEDAEEEEIPVDEVTEDPPQSAPEGVEPEQDQPHVHHVSIKRQILNNLPL